MALDYFSILEMSPTSDIAVIKKSYRSVAMKHHPDRNPGDPTAAEKFKKATEAFEFLSNPSNLGFTSSHRWSPNVSDLDRWDEDSQTITKGGRDGFQIELPPGMSLERFMEILKSDPNIQELDVNLPYIEGAEVKPDSMPHKLNQLS